MILAATGHRPDKLGGYSDDVFTDLVSFAKETLRRFNPDLVISGMALGWDQAIAQAAIDLNISFHAYIPFIGQEKAWPIKSQDYYNILLKMAQKVVICSEGDYAAYKMHHRNKRMVDDYDQLLALWDGSTGGTSNCINYAYLKIGGINIHNVWDNWKAFQSQPFNEI